MSKNKKIDPKKAEAPVEAEPVGPVIESGFFRFADNSSYEGTYEVLNGQRIRCGEGIYINGPEAYKGSWQNDLMHGDGDYYFSTGSNYKGEFKNGMFDGEGTYTFSDGCIYSGGWRANKMHGKGEYVDGNKIRWTGNFFNGCFESGKSYVNLRPAKVGI